MQKILEKAPSYYRIGFGSGNLIYFSHEISLKENEYLDLSIRDVVFKIDELVKAYNEIQLDCDCLSKEIVQLREENVKLAARLENIERKVFSIDDQKIKVATTSTQENQE